MRRRTREGAPRRGGHSPFANRPPAHPDAHPPPGTPWTEDEHRLFLLGLQKLGKGDWRGISRLYVQTRTPTQVASHAQKYFIRLSNVNKRKRRASLFDMVTESVRRQRRPHNTQASQAPLPGSHPRPPCSFSSSSHTRTRGTFSAPSSSSSKVLPRKRPPPAACGTRTGVTGASPRSRTTPSPRSRAPPTTPARRPPRACPYPHQTRRGPWHGRARLARPCQ